MATFKAVVLSGDIHKKADGTTNIKIRITHKRKIAYIKTEYYVLPAHFDNKSGLVKSDPNSEQLNMLLFEAILGYKKKDIGLGHEREFMVVSQLKAHFEKDATIDLTDIEFFEYVQNEKQNKSDGTRQQYEALVSSLTNFIGTTLYFRSITYRFLLNYERFLRNHGVKNGIVNYMSTFRSLFNTARKLYNDEECSQIRIPHYPFAKYVMPKRINKSTREHVLDPIELKMFINYKPENAGEQFAKDQFLLMVYLIGIEAKDLFYLPKTKTDRVKYIRFKTGGEFSIKIEPEAAEIINRQTGQKTLINSCEHIKHHKSFYRKVNNYLQGETSHNIIGIFPKLGISKKVTTKWARHTWATIARNDCRIDKDDVALCLGHKDQDNETTDTYTRYDYTIIDDSNRKVLDFIINLSEAY